MSEQGTTINTHVTQENQPASTTPLTYASAPFDDPEADIILRTSDDISFRVYSVLLRISSPFFKTMLSLPQPPPSVDDVTNYEGNTPVIHIVESSKVIDPMLRFCYPFGDPRITVFSDIVGVIDAMRKYELVQLERAAELFRSEEVLAVKPFEVYAIACKLKVEDEARKAAFYTLRHSLPATVPEEFNLLSGAQLYQLLLYRMECVNVAQSLLSTVTWLPSHPWFTCNSYCPSSTVELTVADGERTIKQIPRKWFQTFINRLENKMLLGEKPWPSALVGKLNRDCIMAERGKQPNYSHQDTRDCECTRQASVQWDNFAKTELVLLFEKSLKSVKLNISF